VEKNVAADRRAATEMVQISGQQGVPVITVDGQVVVGFDQPRLRHLIANRSQPKPRLGAAIIDAASRAQQDPGIPPTGAYVGSIRPGSVAERAGLLAGDVIVALDGHPIRRAADLHRLVPETPKGQDLSLTYVRNGQEHKATIRF